MLHAIAPNIWHVQHNFITGGLNVSSRMTVVCLSGGRLWLHSPVPLSDAVRAQLAELGEVRFIVAPCKFHHLFARACLAHYPNAKLFGAPGLAAKRPSLATMRTLTPVIEPEWQGDLEQICFDGIPIGNEVVWYHKPSCTLILTDLCQWWQGELTFGSSVYARLTGVRSQLKVPRTIRMMVKDKPAARASAQRILQWPFERVIVAHNAIVDTGAHQAVQKAFACFD